MYSKQKLNQAPPPPLLKLRFVRPRKVRLGDGGPWALSPTGHSVPLGTQPHWALSGTGHSVALGTLLLGFTGHSVTGHSVTGHSVARQLSRWALSHWALSCRALSRWALSCWASLVTQSQHQLVYCLPSMLYLEILNTRISGRLRRPLF